MDVKTFFKKILGTLEQEVKTEVNRTKQQLKSEARQAVSQTQQQSQQPQQPRPQQPQAHAETERVSRTDSQCMTYFREILSQEFGQYAVRENVPVQELVGDIADQFKLYETRPYQAYKAEWGLPYTFVLYSGESVKGVILIGKGQNQSRKVKFLISKMYAKKIHAPFITFYMDAPNERGYVVERIREFVGR